jgi:hypothetical protein
VHISPLHIVGGVALKSKRHADALRKTKLKLASD